MVKGLGCIDRARFASGRPFSRVRVRRALPVRRGRRAGPPRPRSRPPSWRGRRRRRRKAGPVDIRLGRRGGHPRSPSRWRRRRRGRDDRPIDIRWWWRRRPGPPSRWRRRGGIPGLGVDRGDPEEERDVDGQGSGLHAAQEKEQKRQGADSREATHGGLLSRRWPGGGVPAVWTHADAVVWTTAWSRAGGRHARTGVSL